MGLSLMKETPWEAAIRVAIRGSAAIKVAFRVMPWSLIVINENKEALLRIVRVGVRTSLGVS